MVRYIAECDTFSGKYTLSIIDAVKPLLRFTADPSILEFDDDLVFVIDALVQKAKG